MSNRSIKWGRITKASSESSQFAVQQVDYLGKLADSMMVFPYGMHANVAPNALALMMSVQGSASIKASIPWDPLKRPVLKEGEVALYHPNTDSVLIFDNEGNINITTGNQGSGNVNVSGSSININASVKVSISSPDTEINGNLTVSGNTALSSTVTSNGVDISDTHSHEGSPTAPNGPVSDTGAPT